MLDSGAYSRSDIDIDAFIKFIKEYKWALDFYVNLDVRFRPESTSERPGDYRRKKMFNGTKLTL